MPVSTAPSFTTTVADFAYTAVAPVTEPAIVVVPEAGRYIATVSDVSTAPELMLIVALLVAEPLVATAKSSPPLIVPFTFSVWLLPKIATQEPSIVTPASIVTTLPEPEMLIALSALFATILPPLFSLVSVMVMVWPLRTEPIA